MVDFFTLWTVLVEFYAKISALPSNLQAFLLAIRLRGDRSPCH